MNRLRFFGLGATILSTFSIAGCTGVLGISSNPQLISKECTTNQQCIAAKGAPAICKKENNTCQLVLNDDCAEILGGDNLKDDDVLLFGALFAMKGTNAAVGKAEDAALHMAFNDFQTVGLLPPIPGGNKGRTTATVVCDDSASNDVALRSVTHMIDDLGIQSFIGPTWSGPTVNFLTKKSVQAGVLSIGSGTTSPDITTLAKGGLYYRTSESTSLEAPPIAKLAADIQGQLTTLDPKLVGKVKVFLGFKGDSFGKGTKTAIVATPLLVNGLAATDPAQKNYQEADYGNPADPNTDPLKYDETISKIIAFQPNIVILSGTGEAQQSIMSPVEQKWPAGVRRPYWVYTHIQVIGSMISTITTADPTGELRKRILGVTYGTTTTDAYRTFRSNFAGTQPADISPDSIDTGTTYDAYYTQIYAAVAAGNKPLTGANIAAGIANLIPGPNATPIDVGPGKITQALGILSAGGRVDLNGTSGPLDFNLQTGDVAQENQVWCMPAAAGGGGVGFPALSGYFFDLNGNAGGSINQITQKCQVDFAPPTP